MRDWPRCMPHDACRDEVSISSRAARQRKALVVAYRGPAWNDSGGFVISGDRRSGLGRIPLVGAWTWCNVVNPISLHCFVSPKIYCDFHRWRLPDELLSKFDIKSDLL
jgi:hypothetical protein